MRVTDSTARSDIHDSAPVAAADENFLARFESCELPEFEWTHLAHIRVAWICLKLASPEVALARMREGILRYNTEVLHRPHKYHETVTVAFARIVAERMSVGEPWTDFAERISDLLDPGAPILLRYYSVDLLSSVAARQAFIEPDLGELPPFPEAG
jgi:hypothetical protein